MGRVRNYSQLHLEVAEIIIKVFIRLKHDLWQPTIILMPPYTPIQLMWIDYVTHTSSDSVHKILYNVKIY